MTDRLLMRLEDRILIAHRNLEGCNVTFVSQVNKSRTPSSRIGESSIVVSQTYKASTKSQELSIRVTADVLSKASMKIGDFVDVLYDKDSDRWMLSRMVGGLKITGKEDAPTGLVRYTLKEGHARLTEERDSLPKRKFSLDDAMETNDGEIIFKLLNEGDEDGKES
ncbi:hypothetical protein [Duffyella gerundensis]|uniref:hypothetical protein n=1 Tax=Duffyella gerundensis TaxID=1619313 RepID=UPI0016549C45|nr:hypothetical protein [Duffyella gerundensis]